MKRARRRSIRRTLRNLSAFSACALLVFVDGTPTQAQEPTAANSPAVRSGCGFLNLTKKDLTSALKECGAFAPFFLSDEPRYQAPREPFALGLRGDEAPMLFGQNRFVQHFPLYLTGLYPRQRNDDGDTAAATVKQAALGGTVRGGMIVEHADDIGQPTVRVGTVIWGAEPPLLTANGKVSRIFGNLTINGHEVAMSLALSPAVAGGGLMIEIKVRGEGEGEVGVPRLRQTGDRSGEPMDMVGRRRAEGEFVFTPATDSQALQNVTGALLKGQWIDVPVRPKGETSYMLTMELARPGKELIKRAFADWNLPDEAR